MESQLRHKEDHHHQHLGGRDHGEQQHGEKKSALGKVKVKAKKIKETIKKHGHIHGHEHHHQDQEQEDEYEDEVETVKDDHAPIQESQFGTNPEEGGQRLDSSNDDVGHGVPPHGLGMAGFTGAGNIGRLIIPEEAPLAPRNTPISEHRQNHKPISEAGDEHKKTLPADHEGSTQPKKSSYAGKMTSVLADKASEAKNMVASKLRPGDEDKVLGQLISGALYNKEGTKQPDAVMDEERKRPVRETVSDAVHKRASDDNEREVKLMGRVTESEEVARRLGTSEEERRGEVTHVPTGIETPVRDWIKETVSSWWTPRNQHPDSSESDRNLEEPAK